MAHGCPHRADLLSLYEFVVVLLGISSFGDILQTPLNKNAENIYYSLLPDPCNL